MRVFLLERMLSGGYGRARERDKVRTAGGAQERWTGRSPSTWPANSMHDGRKHVRERNAHSGTPDTTPKRAQCRCTADYTRRSSGTTIRRDAHHMRITTAPGPPRHNRSPCPTISRLTHHARDARRSRHITLLSTSRSTVLNRAYTFLRLRGSYQAHCASRRSRGSVGDIYASW
ncbi:hypothetical protein K438DRAFT_1030290 [Mycena galopus ATCC 62051]|nr:hypothetical protein K438DRAFT_1030290 [Mycena galopus ATCC 62051]